MVLGKKNHISISLLKRSLRRNRKLKRAKSLRKGLCFPERAVYSRVQIARVDEVSIPDSLRIPLGELWKTPPQIATDLVEFCNSARNDSSLPGDACATGFGNRRAWSNNLGKLIGKLRAVEWMRLAS